LLLVEQLLVQFAAAEKHEILTDFCGAAAGPEAKLQGWYFFLHGDLTDAVFVLGIRPQVDPVCPRCGCSQGQSAQGGDQSRQRLSAFFRVENLWQTEKRILFLVGVLLPIWGEYRDRQFRGEAQE